MFHPDLVMIMEALVGHKVIGLENVLESALVTQLLLLPWILGKDCHGACCLTSHARLATLRHCPADLSLFEAPMPQMF